MIIICIKTNHRLKASHYKVSQNKRYSYLSKGGFVLIVFAIFKILHRLRSNINSMTHD